MCWTQNSKNSEVDLVLRSKSESPRSKMSNHGDLVRGYSPALRDSNALLSHQAGESIRLRLPRAAAP